MATDHHANIELVASGALSFYSTSAQVIPVLFIALAFETRALGQLAGDRAA